VNGGSIVWGSINKGTWSELYNAMRVIKERDWTLGQLQSKYNRLRTDHREFLELLTDETGFGCDPMTNTVDGSEG
jgi:hypothetical protein